MNDPRQGSHDQGEGGGAVRGLASTGVGSGSTLASHEAISVGSGKGAKGRARARSSEAGDDEGYYAHSYGQLAIHREMIQVRFTWQTTNDTIFRMM